MQAVGEGRHPIVAIKNAKSRRLQRAHAVHNLLQQRHAGPGHSGGRAPAPVVSHPSSAD